MGYPTDWMGKVIAVTRDGLRHISVVPVTDGENALDWYANCLDRFSSIKDPITRWDDTVDCDYEGDLVPIDWLIAYGGSDVTCLACIAKERFSG